MHAYGKKDCYVLGWQIDESGIRTHAPEDQITTEVERVKRVDP